MMFLVMLSLFCRYVPIFALFLLTACDSARQDFRVEKIDGVEQRKVLQVLKHYARVDSSKTIAVRYEITERPALFDKNGLSQFVDLLIKGFEALLIASIFSRGEAEKKLTAQVLAITI